MILTKTVMLRGKEVKVTDLRPNSCVKVDVECPVCRTIRTVHYKSIVSAGHCVCQKCRMIQETGIKLDIGERYGMLSVVSASAKSGFSVCECECGNINEFNNWNLKSGKTNSCGCLKKLNFKNTARLKDSEHWNWKGGVSPERCRTMASKRYKDWRKAVFERDGWKCRRCGEEKNLQAHHLERYIKGDSMSTDVANGATVCPKCHRDFHKKYGRKDINMSQFEDFIKTGEKF